MMASEDLDWANVLIERKNLKLLSEYDEADWVQWFEMVACFGLIRNDFSPNYPSQEFRLLVAGAEEKDLDGMLMMIMMELQKHTSKSEEFINDNLVQKISTKSFWKSFYKKFWKRLFTKH